MTEQGRRRKIVLIAPELFVDIMTVGYHGHIRCTEGLPADARIVGHGYDHRRDAHYLVFESAEWESVELGMELPQQEVRFTSYSTTALLDQALAFITGRMAPDAKTQQWLDNYQAVRGMIE